MALEAIHGLEARSTKFLNPYPFKKWNPVSRLVVGLLYQWQKRGVSLFGIGVLYLSLVGVGCAITPPVLEMALADAAMRQARAVGVETKQPTLYAQALEAYQKAQYYHHKKNKTQARAFAIRARQLVEKAELSVVEESGLVSEESQVVRAGTHEEVEATEDGEEESVEGESPEESSVQEDDPFEAY